MVLGRLRHYILLVVGRRGRAAAPWVSGRPAGAAEEEWDFLRAKTRLELGKTDSRPVVLPTVPPLAGA